MEHQLIAIGDMTTDAFIRLKEAEVHCNINKDNCTICMRFGDKIPFDFVEEVPAVGNAANAAVAAARLGLSSALVSDIGSDDIGKQDIESLARDAVDTTFVSRHAGMASNHHYVLWYGDERTILVKHQPYPYRLPEIGEPQWLYLTSLSDHSLPYHREISRYLKKHPSVKLAFQPGTFQINLGVENLRALYERTEVFICNIEEARRILKTTEKDIGKLFSGMHSLGPTTVLLTDGPRGAYASDGGETWFMPPYQDPKAPVDRTGAGDAFGSTFVSALILGTSVPEALTWAPINSMSVVQYIGAQKGLLSQVKLEEYLKNAPEDYKPKQLK